MSSFIACDLARRRKSCDSQLSSTSKASKCSDGTSSIASSSAEIYCIKQLTDFQSVVNSDAALEMFRRYLEEIHCGECLNFYLDVEEYKNQCNQLNCQSVKYEKARQIYDCYINMESGMCKTPVNIDAESRRNIQDAIESVKLSPHVFNQAQGEMLRMIKFDLLPRFIKAEVDKRRNSEDGKENNGTKAHRMSFLRLFRNTMSLLEGRVTPKRSMVFMHGDTILDESLDTSRKLSIESLPIRRYATKVKSTNSDEKLTWRQEGQSGPRYANFMNLKYSAEVDDASISRVLRLKSVADMSKELLFRACHSTSPYRHKVGQIVSTDDCVRMVAFNKKQLVETTKVSKTFQNTLSSLLPSSLLFSKSPINANVKCTNSLY